MKDNFEADFYHKNTTNELKVLYNKEEFASKKIFEILTIIPGDELEEMFLKTFSEASAIKSAIWTRFYYTHPIFANSATVF